MTAVDYLIKHPEIKHGNIKIGFTPDEEIGRGVDKFDVKKFDAEFAYTLDGGGIGELEFENFNAAHAKVIFNGSNIHPGYAKDKMINSMILAMEFNSMLPVNERPEFTQDYEGFYHLIKMEGSVENSSITYIIRDHNRDKFEAKKVFIQQTVDYMNKKYRENTVVLELKDQYYNMREQVEKVFHVVETAKKAMELVGVNRLLFLFEEALMAQDCHIWIFPARIYLQEDITSMENRICSIGMNDKSSGSDSEDH